MLDAESFPLFLETARELDELSKDNDDFPELYLAHLYTARKRNMQPLRQRMYGHTYASGGRIEPMPQSVLPLFEALPKP